MQDAQEIQSGNPAALVEEGEFSRLVERHRAELHAYCYRMLGSLHDAEDAVQETLLRAWRRLDTYEGRASLRAWLYKIATNICLDFLKRPSRRILPMDFGPAAQDPEAPSRHVNEPFWLEPYPDVLLDQVSPDPEASYTTQESITLAFLIALQYLPARQRAALILRDVVGWPADRIAELLECSVASANSALQRARATLRKSFPAGHEATTTGNLVPDGPQRALLDDYVRAWEAGDLDALVMLLKEDVVVSMPPDVLWFQGRDVVRTFFKARILAGDARNRFRLKPVRANAQPSFALYQQETEGTYRLLGIKVLTVADHSIAALTGFMDPSLFSRFDVPTRIAV